MTEEKRRTRIYQSTDGGTYHYVCEFIDGVRNDWVGFDRVDGGPWVARPRRERQ